MKFFIFWALLLLSQALHLRQQHDQFSSQSDTEKRFQSSFTIVLIVFLVMAAAIISVFCFIAWRSSRQQQLAPYVPLQEPLYFPNNNTMQFGNPQPKNPQFNANQLNNYPNQLNGYPNQLNAYPNQFNNNNHFVTQSNQPQPNPKMINQPTNTGLSASGLTWSEPDYFAEGNLRENCSFCRSYQKEGLAPRLVVGCPTGHAFHISCLSQFRSTQTYNASCPTCKQTISNTLRFFCSNCKQRSVEVNVNDFSDRSGVISADALLSRCGDLCPQCRRT